MRLCSLTRAYLDACELLASAKHRLSLKAGVSMKAHCLLEVRRSEGHDVDIEDLCCVVFWGQYRAGLCLLRCARG